MKLKLCLLLGIILPVLGIAQGNYLYTWHGDSGLFQGSFQVTPEENQPGGYFESQTFYNSIVFTSPDEAFTYSWPGGIASGRMGPPFNLSFSFNDNVANRKLTSSAVNSWAGIWEYDMHDPANPVTLHAENGSWVVSYLPVPEPSCTSLLLLSGVALVVYKRKGGSRAALSCKS